MNVSHGVGAILEKWKQLQQKKSKNPLVLGDSEKPWSVKPRLQIHLIDIDIVLPIV